MVDMRSIYKEQLRLVKKVTEDIVKHKASPEVIEHAKKYARLENENGGFWRINYGEAYAYVNIDENGNPTGEIWWNNDEMGVEHEATYEDTLADLESMTIEEAYNKSNYANCYDEQKVYKLIYERM